MKEKLLKKLTKALQKKYGRKLKIEERSVIWDTICLLVKDEYSVWTGTPGKIKVVKEDIKETTIKLK